MEANMRVTYTGQPYPNSLTKAIFLAGPTPRSKDVASWRPEALRLLEALGYDGDVFVPENAPGTEPRSDYDDCIEWEDRGLNLADCIVFWVPRELKDMPAFTTNDEWGFWKKSGKVVFGAPDWAAKIRYQRHYAAKYLVPTSDTLEGALKEALAMIGDGALRFGGERDIPLLLWRTASFQSWHQAQRRAGNRLDGAKVEWTFRVGKDKRAIYCWAVHAKVWVASEHRYKSNEVIIGRPDISSVLMYRKGPNWRGDDETDIVLVREFRSPASTADGFIRELPGGSSFKPGLDPLEIASEEVREETGLVIAPGRISAHGSRQLMGTFSTHKAHLFSVELTDDEIEGLRKEQDKSHGDSAEGETGERTYVEVCTLTEILNGHLVDWSTLGMILQVFS
jgi:8-oxo-dGTP pyrophosphatase MutT (NUDIX family)